MTTIDRQAPDKKSGLEHLHKLAADHPGRLILAKADLLDDGAFDAPMGAAVWWCTPRPRSSSRASRTPTGSWSSPR
jgi:hypothetical protein